MDQISFSRNQPSRGAGFGQSTINNGINRSISTAAEAGIDLQNHHHQHHHHHDNNNNNNNNNHNHNHNHNNNNNNTNIRTTFNVNIVKPQFRKGLAWNVLGQNRQLCQQDLVESEAVAWARLKGDIRFRICFCFGALRQYAKLCFGIEKKWNWKFKIRKKKK